MPILMGLDSPSGGEMRKNRCFSLFLSVVFLNDKGYEREIVIKPYLG